MRPLAVLLLAGLLLALPGAGSLRAAGSPPRLGIYHPAPRLCLADEPAQRDLWVLRLAFGVGLSPAQWRTWPWFYGEEAAPKAAGGGKWLTLDTQALWGLPMYGLVAGSPDFQSPDVPDRLATWRARTVEHVPGLALSPFLSLAPFRLVVPAEHPFLASRLAGSAVLPAADPVSGSEAPPPAPLCRSWPKGATWEPPTAAHSYVLHHDRTEGAGPFVLTGYRERDALWHDYRRGRLDAVLVDGTDWASVPAWARRADTSLGGVLQGSQQIVMRVLPALVPVLSEAARQALSMAIPRDALAGEGGPGAFGPAESFLTPLLEPGRLPPAATLARDTLRARQLWLSSGAALPSVRLLLPAHPVLERIAQRIKDQWQKTLNLNLVVEPLGVDEYAAAVAAAGPALVLEVADLDDGSLQSLWQHGLGQLKPPRRAPASLERALRAWEPGLRQALPYLPLLHNRHYVLVRHAAGRAMLERICPGCRPLAGDLPRVAPEPVSPRG